MNAKKWALIGVMIISCLVPLFYWARSLSSGLPLGVYLYAAGRILALIGFVAIFYQYVLSAKIKWIERGIGLDKMIAIHRTSGIAGLVLILLHPVPLFLSDIVQGYLPGITPLKLLGVVTALILAVAAGEFSAT